MLFRPDLNTVNAIEVTFTAQLRAAAASISNNSQVHSHASSSARLYLGSGSRSELRANVSAGHAHNDIVNMLTFSKSNTM